MIKKVMVFIGAILGSSAAGAIGSLATSPNIPSWYATLDKPPLIPPNEVFGPVWSVLYVMMGIALALIILEPTDQSKSSAYGWFGAQLSLNTLWSFVFFGLQSPWLGVFVILLLIGSIVLTIRQFYRVNKIAAWLLVPYLLWVSFATYLTIGVAFLNS